jgi:hypothetical protein
MTTKTWNTLYLLYLHEDEAADCSEHSDVDSGVSNAVDTIM